MKIARALLLVALAVGAALPAAGCSSSSGGGSGTDPAALVPAQAPLYAEATVRPEDAVRSGAQAALRKILHTNDPGAAIAKALEGGPGKGLSFKDDIEPWLGDKVAAAVTSLRGPEGRPTTSSSSTPETTPRPAPPWQAAGRRGHALLQGRRLPLRRQGPHGGGQSSTTTW
jgi:hypothetical protein